MRKYLSFDEYQIYWEYLCPLIKIRTDCSWELMHKFVSTLPTQGHKLLILWNLKMAEHGGRGKRTQKGKPTLMHYRRPLTVFAFGKNCIGIFSIVTPSPMLNPPSSSPPSSFRVNKSLFPWCLLGKEATISWTTSRK